MNSGGGVLNDKSDEKQGTESMGEREAARKGGERKARRNEPGRGIRLTWSRGKFVNGNLHGNVRS